MAKRKKRKSTRRRKTTGTCKINKTVKVRGKVLKLKKGLGTLSESQAKTLAKGVRMGGGSASVRKNNCGGGYLLYTSKSA